MLRLSTKLQLLTMALIAVFSAPVVLAADDICQSGTCLSNGDTVCDRATGNCPPCMYTIPGGYSCYGKISGSCPFPDAVTICPDTPVTTRPPVVVTQAPSVTRPPTAAAASAAPTPTAAPLTAAPVVTPAPVPVVTPAPVPTPALAPVPAPASASASSSTPAPVTPAVDTPTVTQATPQVPTTTSSSSTDQRPESSGAGTVAPAKETPSSKSPPSSPKPTEAQNVVAETKSNTSKSSPKGVNAMIIVGAVVGVLIVAIFIVRRVRQRRDMPVNMGFDDLGFDKSPVQSKETIPNAAHLGGYNTNTNTNTNAQARRMSSRIDYSTLEPAYPITGTRPKGRPLSPPMAARSSVGEDGQSELEFSVHMENATQHQHQYQSDLTSSGHSELSSDYSSIASRPRAKSRVRGLETSLIQNQYPELVGSYNSDVCSVIGSEQSDEYDIVDPGAIRPGERSNTETLVADGRFGKFSMASLTESYVSEATTEQSSEYSNSVYI